MDAESLRGASRPKRKPSGVLVIRAAQAAGMSVEAFIGHGNPLTEAGRCKACGSRVGDKPERRTA